MQRAGFPIYSVPIHLDDFRADTPSAAIAARATSQLAGRATHAERIFPFVRSLSNVIVRELQTMAIVLDACCKRIRQTWCSSISRWAAASVDYR